jgi:hypothetical protein
MSERIVDEEVHHIKTGVVSQAYRDGWDRIFGEPEKPEEQTYVMPAHDDNTGVDCRWAGRPVPKAWLEGHDCCYVCNDFAATLP